MIVRTVVLLTGSDKIAFLKLVAAGSRGAPVFADPRFSEQVRRLRRYGIAIVTLRRRRSSGGRHTRYALRTAVAAAVRRRSRR